MVSVEQLERVLRDFNFRYKSDVSAILTKTGVPIAIQANVKVKEDHFGTMAATLMGSSEVIYREVGKESPERIVVHSRGVTLVVLNLERNAFFVTLALDDAAITKELDQALESLKKVLEPLRPLDKFIY